MLLFKFYKIEVECTIRPISSPLETSRPIRIAEILNVSDKFVTSLLLFQSVYLSF